MTQRSLDSISVASRLSPPANRSDLFDPSDYGAANQAPRFVKLRLVLHAPRPWVDMELGPSARTLGEERATLPQPATLLRPWRSFRDRPQSMRNLTWNAFDQAVEQIAAGSSGFNGIFGIPRGGLVLAVALSHRLGLPLLTEARAGCLVVDDVYETGLTLGPYKHLENSQVVVWVSKAEPQWWQAVEITDSSEWIVFPWESGAGASADEQRYRASRS